MPPTNNAATPALLAFATGRAGDGTDAGRTTQGSGKGRTQMNAIFPEVKDVVYDLSIQTAPQTDCRRTPPPTA
jgi:hypothetical protein